MASPSPVTASLLGIFGRTSTVYIDTPLSKVFLVLSFLVLFTFGPVNVGCTHLIRSMIREEPVFFWSDFFYAIKKNFRQGMIFGIIDCVLCFMIAYNIIWYNANASVNTMMLLFLFMTWGMLVLYGMMRMYIYLMMITFDLSLPKLLKNAVFFAALGIKRNLLAVLGIVIMIALTLFVSKSKMGKAMRACSEDKAAAQLMGINVNATISATFAIGSALAAIAGVLLCSFNTSLMPTTGSMPGIKAFTAAVFGGIGSIPGAFLGGLLLGIIEALAKAYISTTLANAIVFAVLIVVLLVKPAGLLGKYVPEKV